MLKKLRIKFIVINMAMIAIVLVVVFTAICAINYQQGISRVYEALEGSLTSLRHNTNVANQGKSPQDSPTPQLSQEPLAGQLTEGTPPEIGGKRGGSDLFIPVAVYAVNEEGSLTATATARTTASIASDILEQAAAKLATTPDGEGNLDTLGLFYAKRQIDNTTYLAFADESEASDWQNLALILAGVGVLALVAFFVISVFFSRWALRPVEAAWTQQRQFVADASHELKTPLTVILANTSILLEHPERSLASQSQWVESTQTEATCMQQLVGDLLLLARIDEGAALPARDCIDLTDLVEGELLQFESVAFERKITLKAEIAHSVKVVGDASRLRRLTTTLIDNACKYANDGGEVNVCLRKDVRYIHLSVHNTGSAIDAKDLPHVFDRFYRADKARTRDNSGYGLGLAIARAVAAEHGGELQVRSSAQDGTVFLATFPLMEA